MRPAYENKFFRYLFLYQFCQIFFQKYEEIWVPENIVVFDFSIICN